MLVFRTILPTSAERRVASQFSALAASTDPSQADQRLNKMMARGARIVTLGSTPAVIVHLTGAAILRQLLDRQWASSSAQRMRFATLLETIRNHPSSWVQSPDQWRVLLTTLEI